MSVTRKGRKCICAGCDSEKPYYARDLCRNCYRKHRRLGNLEQRRKQDQEYYREHQELINARNLARYYKNREAYSRKAQEYYQKNKERIKAKAKTYYHENKEQCRISAHKYYQAHREEILKRVYRWAQMNPEKVKAIRRRWRKNHPESARENCHRRRAREAEVHNDLTAEQIMRIYTVGRCFYCFKPINLTLDHFVPITKGGGTTKANMVLACRKCNSSKHTKLPQEILAQLDFMDSVSILK